MCPCLYTLASATRVQLAFCSAQALGHARRAGTNTSYGYVQFRFDGTSPRLDESHLIPLLS